jgi:hypothetical protein
MTARDGPVRPEMSKAEPPINLIVPGMMNVQCEVISRLENKLA